MVIISRVLSLSVLALALVALPAAGNEQSAKPDALIGGGEQIGDHQGRSEDIHDHEGATEDIHAHEGSAEDIQRHEGAAEDIHDHHAESGSIEGRSVQSERLSGMENDPALRLSAAREKLLNARQRHAREVEQAKQAVPASRADDQVDARAEQGTWAHKLEIAKQRITIAEANAQIYDEAYADMIQKDYPRGKARQDLIDSRDKAARRLESERKALPKLVARARAEGVPQSVLYDYE